MGFPCGVCTHHPCPHCLFVVEKEQVLKIPERKLFQWRSRSNKLDVLYKGGGRWGVGEGKEGTRQEGSIWTCFPNQS